MASGFEQDPIRYVQSRTSNSPILSIGHVRMIDPTIQRANWEATCMIKKPRGTDLNKAWMWSSPSFRQLLRAAAILTCDEYL